METFPAGGIHFRDKMHFFRDERKICFFLAKGVISQRKLFGMRKLRLSYVIHFFALAHGAVCGLCATLGVPDTTLLTLMTIILTVIICTRHRLRVEATALAILLVNIFGFLLGTSFALLLDHIMPPDWVPHMISTILTTELIGWVLYWQSLRLPRKWYMRSRRGRVGLLVFVIIGIFLARMSLTLMSEGFNIHSLSVTPELLADMLAVLLVVFFALVLYGLAMHERELTHRAELRYATLKNLVNPHFLFNSLNILDGLIRPGNDAAKDYLRRLSSLYRYMTVHESESLVRLSDERQFARDYLELLLVRFGKAIDVHVRIRDEELSTRIVPCSLQILLENATKHNAFSVEKPLVIDIASEKGWIVVCNNISPRTSVAPSTGVGLKYIRTRYEDICDRDISVSRDGGRFTVRVPLID